MQLGGDFGKLARKHSDDIGSKDYEGRLGFMEKGQLVPEYEKAALNLKVGEISKPVRTDFGFHIIQLLAVKGERFDTRHILIRP
ncbi:peptidylprolyl isomerase [Porifericola rhodea]|uniref:peptidylprolyl isomerase n=1 Tax=Porifericola rhodea TaxID=930972 RepID=UPI0026653958|nr:peptidylprolyl isomerase [Porifericola rhodea]WKN33919.1 peptidylprolyl isomerase [Porifericola rhodea]